MFVQLRGWFPLGLNMAERFFFALKMPCTWRGLLAKSLESMLLLWEQHLNAIPEGDESASRLRSTANAAGKAA